MKKDEEKKKTTQKGQKGRSQTVNSKAHADSAKRRRKPAGQAEPVSGGTDSDTDGKAKKTASDRPDRRSAKAEADGGEKEVQIEKALFESYCTLACTEQDICDLFGGIEHEVLDQWCMKEYGMGFAQIYKKKTGPVKLALRKNQLLLSKTSSMMAIFLGKNMLGQSDHPDPPIDANIIRESNEQMLALADLINRPSPVRTLEDLERKGEEKG